MGEITWTCQKCGNGFSGKERFREDREFFDKGNYHDQPYYDGGFYRERYKCGGGTDYGARGGYHSGGRGPRDSNPWVSRWEMDCTERKKVVDLQSTIK